ncbi:MULTISPECIES: hypothetical protein [Sphingobium]|jgi:ElaB/YqjD/DUF883 family membrane-anchored ribosome-binding protein|uniref:hypothetical protein n=1 Tax=Sphingobium TaxID=165695 RepID=UPI000C51E164|nr:MULTISPECIES: hypothetical protein [Sphingobium]MBS49621.1 hypothetical protein [Sphingobium sp.]MCC4255006.1 hypothetical protein [Sphingobium lactosutens]MEC9017294.1 hypothetical protein [Pseudomonadota bacterium]MEE2741299.1 hypothetical protein [Pseudomonadota bacterium]|tara:strand:- start:3011 stop:3652 length:642 start_codon:yes stop_codon:yes gene_type:complete
MADIRAQISRAREAANDAATNASDRIRETSGKARDSAGELINSSREKAGDAYADARDRTQRVATRANQIVQDHPVMAVAGAVAAGALVAWMFPKSRRAMKALPGLATTLGARAVEAAAAARSAAADEADIVTHKAGGVLTKAKAFAAQGADSLRHRADDAYSAASDAASSARENLAAADLSAKASRLADDVTALVVAKVDAISDAVKARLPKS